MLSERLRNRRLKGRPWREAPLPSQAVLDVPTMLTEPELQLLHWLGAEYWSGEGKILDGGCFLGGSTASLASGVAAGGKETAGEPPIVTYDLFRLDQFMPVHLSDADAEELDEGDSFRGIFDRNIAPWSELVEVREGDITQYGWSGEPIEVAFLDLLKTWPLNDYVLREFFGSMIPGRTILVQQDFTHEFCPWIHVTMGMLDDYFEQLDFLDYYSAVYLLREPIPAEVLATRTARDLTAEQMIGYMDVAIAPAEGEIRGTLEVAKAMLLRIVRGEDAMTEQLAAVRSEYAASERVLTSADMVAGWGTLIGTWGLRLRGR